MFLRLMSSDETGTLHYAYLLYRLYTTVAETLHNDGNGVYLVKSSECNICPHNEGQFCYTKEKPNNI